MSKPSTSEQKKLRIGFIHPDLGIGGAERLVVDAAVSLQRLGHDITLFTSRHDPARCFPETADGTLSVHVLGSSLPQRLCAAVPLSILFSIARSLLLSFLLLCSLYLLGPASALNPLSPLRPFDVFVVDQQSVCVPLLRALGGTRVVFYCHFPDKLLSGGWEIRATAGGGQDVYRRNGGVGEVVRRVYRWPIDALEEWTTGQSDIILSNSHFTSKVYAAAFPTLGKRTPRVVYPCIDVESYQPHQSSKGKGKGKGTSASDDGLEAITSDRPTLLSLNRFEAKKNAALALRAFARLQTDGLVPADQFASTRLVLGGGYDTSLPDNVHTLSALQNLATSLSLLHHTLSTPASPSPPPDTQVLFILNFTSAQRTYLLTSPRTLALLYTPENEHFGIVPVEAMACGLPVLACDSGGPTETIVDPSASSSPSSSSTASSAPADSDVAKGTGLLRPGTPDAWAPALAQLIGLPPAARAALSKRAKQRVQDHFSLSTLGREMERACRDALAAKDPQEQIGDTLIRWGGGVVLGAAVALGATLWLGW